MKAQKKLHVLFISHEASVSGAPILLLNLLKLIKKENWYSTAVILKRGGSLQEEFFKLSKTVLLKPVNYQNSKSIFYKVADFIKYQVQLRKALAEVKKADLIFSNTITNGRLLYALRRARKPVVVYVHELESSIQFYQQHGDVSLSLKLAHLILVPSKPVAENLVVRHQVPQSKIQILNYYFPLAVSQYDPGHYNILVEKKKDIVLNVVGMGTANYRKGIDLFLETCILVNKKNTAIHFTWIGDYIEDEVRMETEAKVKAGKLESCFTLTGFLPPHPLQLRPFDVLALTSREDPYPLVVLEAALLGKPAVVFAGTGGMEDFVKDGCGFLIPSVSPQLMADKIIELAQKPDELNRAGEQAYQKALQKHSSEKLIHAQLAASFELVLTNTVT